MYCPNCGKRYNSATTYSYCPVCGVRLHNSTTGDGEERQTPPHTMEGRVWTVNWKTGGGVIYGSDGNEYQFTRQVWRLQSGPRPGIKVTFVSEGQYATDVYVFTRLSSPSAGSEAVPPTSSTTNLHIEFKSKIAAGLLGILLGGLGIHKFYLGYTGEGVILLLAGTLGWLLVIPGIIAVVVGIIEGIIYLAKPDEEFDRVYVRGRQAWF